MHEHKSSENIKLAASLNLIFAILETIGGLLTNSISILSDAIHDLGDTASMGISYLLEKKSKKEPNNEYTYGYLRYSLIGALLSSTILLIGSIIVIYNAVPRLIKPEIVNYDGMIIFALFGILINGYAAYRTSKANSLNEKAINLHMLEDVLGWIAVLIGSIIIRFTKLYIIDPILSIIIAIYILYHVYKNLKNIFDIFMEKAPNNIDINNIKNDILKEQKLIKDIHHIHIWTLDGINNYLTCHVVLNKDIKNDEIIKLKNDIKESLISKNISHSTLEIEYKNEECIKTKD